ncbi:S-layer family protein, partial [Cohnella sp. CFH 77786]|uniref:beta strand repeat-containing protein n=1 Tax=Cohnella sp. CFH 77786 TaxID=2662265 RepID=UPI001C60E8B7
MRRTVSVILSFLVVLQMFAFLPVQKAFAAVTDPNLSITTTNDQAGQRADYTVSFTVTDAVYNKMVTWDAGTPRFLVYFYKNNQNSTREYITLGVPFSGGITASGLTLTGAPSMGDSAYMSDVQQHFSNIPNPGDVITVTVKDVINPVDAGTYQIRALFYGADCCTSTSALVGDKYQTITGSAAPINYATITPDNPEAGATTDYTFDLTLLRDAQAPSVTTHVPEIWLYWGSSDSSSPAAFWDFTGSTVELTGANFVSQNLGTTSFNQRAMQFKIDRQLYKNDHLVLKVKNVKNPTTPSGSPDPRYGVRVNVSYDGTEFGIGGMETIDKGVDSFQISPPLDYIEVTPATATVNIGETQQYTATAHYTDGSTSDISNVATWTLADPTKATINTSGLATGSAAGTTGVTATWGGKSGNASLTVNAGPTLQSITVSPATATINIGQYQAYSATANFSDGSTQDVTTLATWGLADAAIASQDVTQTYLFRGQAAGTTGISATWNGMTGNASLTVNPPVTLTSITVTPATATVQVGGTQQYTATANYSNGTTQNVTNMATWALGDPTKATINATGLATGTAIGTTGVTATWGGMTGNASLTVTAAPVTLQSITVTPATATVAVGGTQQYTATANFSDGSTQDVTNTAAWMLQFPAMASINNSGLATGNAVGTTGVAATWNGMTGFASLTVTAAPVTLQSITVTPATATVQVGDTQQYTATANFSDGSTQDVTNTATWALGDPTKATINASGLATGSAAGTTGVTATWNGMTGNASLTVSAAPVPVTLQSITVTPATATIQIGNTQQYNATANFSDGSTQDVTNAAAWALGDPTKATINASGLATGSAAGTTGVTATWNGMTGNASLTVTAAPVTPPTGGGSSDPTLQSITVTPATATVQVGDTQQYTATANYSDGSKKDVTNSAAWALGDPTKATINASGLTTGSAAGTTGVTATWNGMTGNASLTVKALPVKITKLEVTPKEP